jgi:putative flippase GtrA
VSSLLHHPEVVQFIRYGIVAGVALAVDFGVMVFTVEVLGAHYLVGAAAGFCVGLVINFLLAEKLAFGRPVDKVSSAWVRLATYTVIGLVGLGLLEVLMWLQVDGFGWPYIVGKCVATVIVFCWNYLGRRALYRRPGSGKDASDA